MKALAIALMISVGTPDAAHGVGTTFMQRLLYGEPPLNGLAAHYRHRRWQRMCRGPARYDAMREAYERGHANPCR
jgi:hypothetical protein